jgi:hypothetical protein
MNKGKAAKGAKGEKGGDGAPSAAADHKTAAATKAALFIAEEELNNQLEVTGGCSKPKPTDVLVVQMCFIPWYAPSPFPFTSEELRELSPSCSLAGDTLMLASRSR